VEEFAHVADMARAKGIDFALSAQRDQAAAILLIELHEFWAGCGPMTATSDGAS